jgi:transcriptional regulator with XRE-family HTH domain
MVLRAREARGWSQERAAQELGMGVRTLRDIEAGKARMTALEALIDLVGAAAPSSRNEAPHEPALALVVDGAKPGLRKAPLEGSAGRAATVGTLPAPASKRAA